MAVECPKACDIRLEHLEEKVKDMGECIFDLKRDLSIRVKTPTLIAIAVISIGVVGAILGSLWRTTASMDAKIDTIKENQVAVMTTMNIHMNSLNDRPVHSDQK